MASPIVLLVLAHVSACWGLWRLLEPSTIRQQRKTIDRQRALINALTDRIDVLEALSDEGLPTLLSLRGSARGKGPEQGGVAFVRGLREQRERELCGGEDHGERC